VHVLNALCLPHHLNIMDGCGLTPKIPSVRTAANLFATVGGVMDRQPNLNHQRLESESLAAFQGRQFGGEQLVAPRQALEGKLSRGRT
jgi:hypothetical protein